MTGIDVSGRIIVLNELQAELEANGVPLPKGLTVSGPPQPLDPNAPLLPPGQPYPFPSGSMLFTYDDNMQPIDLPAAAGDIVAGYAYVKES